ncbi:MAG TPA: plastocyanin/azurin family copper-binding protein [Mycobacteriales bacterium]|nr:plastocyanin/azurin family copper-binding protein [Mycobacteriales bacterium]
MKARRPLAALALFAAAAASLASLGTSASAASATVDVVDSQFVPARVGVSVGDSVTWTFSGQAPHSVTFEANQAKVFDSHPTCGQSGGACSTRGQTATTTFESAGSFRYFCKIHGGPGGVGMSGVVDVTAASASPSASGSPTPTPQTTSFAPTASPTAASPSATSAPEQAPTLNAPTTAVAGVLIAVSGTAAPGALVELFGVTAPNGTLRKVNDTTADASGNWVRTIRPLRNVNLQARVGEAFSATRFIAVSTAVRQSVSPLAGCVVQVSGAVFEPKPGATVFIRAIDGAGRTVSLGTGSVQSDGRFLLRKPFACGQALRVYTVIEGDNVNRPGATGTQTITTRR